MLAFRKRVIPVLLLDRQVLYKTIRFRDRLYVGDPFTAVRILNEKEVDELIILDIGSVEPNYGFIEKLASECFMPLCYGGGVRTIDQIRRIVGCGVEKVAINTAAIEVEDLVKRASEALGSSTIVISVDVKQETTGQYSVWSHGGRLRSPWELAGYLRKLQRDGAGEILINSIDRDGTMTGYDLDLINLTTQTVSVPVIACGGAAGIEDLRLALKLDASAAAAGSLFVFKGKHRAVLISYPPPDVVDALSSTSPTT